MSTKNHALTNEIYDGSIVGQEATQKKKYLVTKHAPIETISSIEYLTGSRTSPSWVAFTADDYVLVDKNYIYFPSGLPSGVRNIRITYTAGFLLDLTGDLYDDEVNTVPFELIDLAERLCVKLFKKRDKEGRSQETFRESSVTWGAFLSSEDIAIIQNYKRTFSV